MTSTTLDKRRGQGKRLTERTCDLCGYPMQAKSPKARYHGGCAEMLRAARRDARMYGNDYPVYRVWMSMRYGEGPWRPQDIEPEDRWEAWAGRAVG